MVEARQLDLDESSAMWQVAPGTYQVEFWKHLAYLAPETPPEKVGYAKEAWLLTNAADVWEAGAWADDHAEGRIVLIYAVLPI